MEGAAIDAMIAVAVVALNKRERIMIRLPHCISVMGRPAFGGIKGQACPIVAKLGPDVARALPKPEQVCWYGWMDWLFGSLIAVVVVSIFVRKDITGWLRDRQMRLRLEDGRAEFDALWKSENPDDSPLTSNEPSDLEAWHRTLFLPAISLSALPEAEPEATGTRVGGPVWLPVSEAWPLDANGIPMEFLAQVDFAGLPPLPEFPEQGVLQFFIGRDDLYGADLDDPLRCDARIMWRPEGTGGFEFVSPPPSSTDSGCSPLSKAGQRRGLCLSGTRIEQPPDSKDWRLEVRLKGMHRRPGVDDVTDLWDDAALPTTHSVGGHPAFTQEDFRGPGHYDEFDRVLLHLTSDKAVQWGDCGEAAFLIRREDLLARRFDRVAFYWDCS